MVCKNIFAPEPYYLMARYYEANNGRFLTKDSFLGMGSESLSLNQYAYTNNNPIMHIDPNGHYYKNIDFGFDSRAAFRTDWLSFARAYFKLTYGGIINLGISYSIGKKVSVIVSSYIKTWIFPKIVTWAGTFLANQIVKRMTSWAVKTVTGLTLGPLRSLYDVVTEGTIQLSNLIFYWE